MLKTYNILILLVVFAFSSSVSPLQKGSAQNDEAQQQEKGPVYHPLRPKPYSKTTVNV
ncbi:hypothetical protein A11Q_1366 [Pseudobdellovibrio exovorus JSS]|uniref:Uncharacterized protein n=1 Tax=Pseudobdellovibrio exovorus JSS TaxID=1184267 RepID=M4V869_9BACT|nr:hypothetical protein A11Q_1366 [Pseudobdellovibrio exovorus JSS]